MSGSFLQFEEQDWVRIVRLKSHDGTNRLTCELIRTLTVEVHRLSHEQRAMVITGNDHFFSAGADLKEIAALTGRDVYPFAKMGQELMQMIDDFPAPVYAAISGYCMGGGLDLALACHYRIAAPHAIFGHRGAALGLMTGWGGTQRLPRVVGKGRALQMFVAAEKIRGDEALSIRLVDAIAEDPVAEAIRRAAVERRE